MPDQKPKSHDVSRIFLGLGSNLAEPKRQIIQAITALITMDDIRYITHSQLYWSHPLGPQDQPNFANCVLSAYTALTPTTLLARIQGLERALGKTKKRHWGERNIDIDLLLFGDVTMHTPSLTLPHPGIVSRDFVYIPLQEIGAKDALSKLPPSFTQSFIFAKEPCQLPEVHHLTT